MPLIAFYKGLRHLKTALEAGLPGWLRLSKRFQPLAASAWGPKLQRVCGSAEADEAVFKASGGFRWAGKPQAAFFLGALAFTTSTSGRLLF